MEDDVLHNTHKEKNTWLKNGRISRNSVDKVKICTLSWFHQQTHHQKINDTQFSEKDFQ